MKCSRLARSICFLVLKVKTRRSKESPLKSIGGDGLVAKSCPTPVTPWTVAHPGSFARGISQARILKWDALPFSRGSSWPKDPTLVSCIAGGFLTGWATRETHQKQLALAIWLQQLLEEIWLL